MDGEWINAILADREFSCLRLRLRPYSIGHEILLSRIESPFVTGSAATLPDLLLACMVCSQTFENGRKLTSSPSLMDLIFMRLWRWRLGKFDALAEMDKFETYRSEAMWIPDILVPLGTGRALNSPWPLRLLVTLMQRFHMTEDQALNTPMVKATALWAVLGDVRGDIEIEGEGIKSLSKYTQELEAKGII
jgi:hypothetical protein